MEKEEFVAALVELTEKVDVLAVNREVKELRTDFEDYLLEATRQYQIAELKAQDNGEEFAEENWMIPLKEKFYAVYSGYKETFKAVAEEKKKAEEENLKQKRILINRLKEVIKTEENIGAAFGAQKEINEKWKNVGPIPRKLSHEIQHEYSRLLEDFFYNINIYKEIKDYDFQKNFTLKKEIIGKLKQLVEEEEITVIQEGIKKYQDEWENIGPTKQELWDKIKDEYWAAVNTVYERIHQYYEGKREERKENSEKKKQLIAKAQELVAKERDNIKSWNKQTKEILQLQEEWKTIGFGVSRKEDNALWKEFRSVCDVFFAEKSTFFDDVHEAFDDVAKTKEQLIEKVEKIKESKDWGETTKAIIRLQKEWKNAGNAGQKNEHKLWKKFRTACDYFFAAKAAHFQEEEQSFEENLKNKEALIEEIKTATLPKEQEEALTKLTEFSERFVAFGFVPRKEKDRVYKAYKSALDAHYDQLDLSGDKKEAILFKAKINTLKGSGDASHLFQKEKQHLRNQMNTISSEITQLENNLGFFKHSKGDNPLKMQVEKDIEQQKEKLNALKTKLKMIPNE